MAPVEDSQRSAAQYDAMAKAYEAHNLDSPFNAYYERPATQGLLGDVMGKRILEVGCGAGPLTEWLVDQGAVVTAMDISAGMVHLARVRLGHRARILLSDLAEPLAFAPDASFDLVVASLVLHYLRDWASPLRELRRVLRSDGALVFSTHHPTMDAGIHSPDDYFAIKQVTELWTMGAGNFEVTFWRRSLTAMAEAIHQAGFLIERLVEPMPDLELSRRDPDKYRLITTQPRFLFFRLKPGPPGTAF
ncbi:MAG: class I SAM-dependent methyltransferase [Acidimicrobiales bacterium]